MKILRKCKFKKRTNDEYQIGWFHKWGKDVYEYTNGDAIVCSVGIIEDENGNIKTVNPEFITFLED